MAASGANLGRTGLDRPNTRHPDRRLRSAPTTIVSLSGDTAVTTSLAIADGTRNDHSKVIKLVRAYQADLEEFGLLDFKSEGRRERSTEFATLNEQ